MNNTHTNIPLITIDGPSGVGKGTTGRLLARKLHWHFLDSGSLYRALAFAAHKQQIDFADEYLLAQLALSLDFKFIDDLASDQICIFVGDQDITQTIREETYSQYASRLAVFPMVRTNLLACQRNYAKPPGLVADGRDMGTVVFPSAQLKIFLTATPLERAKRRLKQLKQRNDHVNLEDLLVEVIARDERDQNRAVAPLKPASDAVIIDTTTLLVADVLELVLAEARKKGLS